MAAVETPGDPRTNRWSRSESSDSNEYSPSRDSDSSPRGETPEAGPSGPVAARRQSLTFVGGVLRRSSQFVAQSVTGVVRPYLPQSVTEMWEPQRDFASVKIPKPANAGGTVVGPASLPSVVAMSGNSPQVMVATSDGGFYVYTIDLQNGGEGCLMRQYSVCDFGMSSSGYGSWHSTLSPGSLELPITPPASPPPGYVLVEAPHSPGGSLFAESREALDSSVEDIGRVFGPPAAGLFDFGEGWNSAEDMWQIVSADDSPS